jgi:CRP-like cAMP-binding protein
MDRLTKRRYNALPSLPRKPLTEYAKGSLIYSGSPDSLYLVACGRVKVSRVAADGYETTMRIVPREGFFGECSLINADERARAVALDWVQVRVWSRAEIEHQIEKMPGLSLALLEEFVITTLDLEDRVQALATRKMPERVMLSLLQLQRTLGEPLADGAVRIASLTHKVIAEHVGTSREIVTAHMNRLRRLGMVRYSRSFIDVDCEAMEQALLKEGLVLRSFNNTFTAVSRG